MSYGEVQKNLIRQAASLNIPIFGEFELTSSCNLNCEMCYVRENHPEELSTSEWKALLKAAVDKGMVFALLTGGEIFKRKDFFEIYNYLYDLGVRITLYTNGTLINEEIIANLKKRPPELMGITLYGVSNETYEAVARVKHGFDLVNRGIDLLVVNNINLLLRTIPIKKLYKEVDEIIQYVKSKGLKMGYSLYVGPRRGCSSSEMEFRLDPDELVIYEEKMKAAFSKTQHEDFRKSSSGFSCSALKSTFFITWNGYMQPCAMLNNPHKKITSDNFNTIWEELVERMKTKGICTDCKTCDLKADCIQCDARRYLEGGFTKCSPYLKNLAKLRKEVRDGKV